MPFIDQPPTVFDNVIGPVTMKIDIIVPFFNEAETAADFALMAAELGAAVRSRFRRDVCFILVDDGSSDGSSALFQRHMREDWSLVVLSRNFGKENAILAGLDHSTADYVLLMDADLQHTTEVALQMIAHILADDDLDMVYAAREDRRSPTRWLARGFYRLVNWGQRYKLPPDAGDFRIMTRSVVEALCRVRDRKRFNKGLYAWVGFNQHRIDYTPANRRGGESKWPHWRLIAFSLEGITSFSVVPLRVVSLLGVSGAVLGFLYGIKIVLEVLITGNAVPGYPSLMVAIVVLGGLNLALVGLIGEYVWVALSEAKRRPNYIVKSVFRSRAAAGARSSAVAAQYR